jgi:hypothetical protein
MAYSPTNIRDPRIMTQLSNYFSSETVTADQIFSTDGVYLDTAFVDGSGYNIVPHFYRLSVAITKLKAPWTPADDSDCSSTSSCQSAPAGGDFNYQFVFQRQDISQAGIDIWGDKQHCYNTAFGYDAERKPVFTELSKGDDDDIFYGNIVPSNDPNVIVYKISQFSSSSTVSIPQASAFTTLTVTKSADGTVALFSAANLMEQNPLGSVQPNTPLRLIRENSK